MERASDNVLLAVAHHLDPYSLRESFKTREELGTLPRNRGGKALHSFTKEEIKKLGVILTNKFNLITTMHLEKRGDNNYYSIYVNKKSLPLFIKIVKPFLLPSMYYKLGLN